MRAKVLLYRLGEDTEKGLALRTVLAEQKLLTLSIRAEQTGETVARLVSANAAVSGTQPPEQTPESEFMLLCGLGDRQLDRLLAAMRRAGVSVPYKAVLTEHNKNWTFADLVTEVAREHEAMRAARKADTVQ